MGQRVVQGGTATLSAYYRNGAGQLVTPVDPFVSILDPGGTVVVSLDTPTEITTGFFQYQFPVPIAADIGGWGANWFGVVDGAAVDDDDVFTVITPGMVDTGTVFVTVDDLENYMMRTLTAMQRQAASVLIGEVISEAEWKMGNGIGAATYTEDVLGRPVPVVRAAHLRAGRVGVDGRARRARAHAGYLAAGSGLILSGWMPPSSGVSSLAVPRRLPSLTSAGSPIPAGSRCSPTS